MHEETKINQLKQLVFNTNKVCVLEVLNADLFAQIPNVKIYSTTGCNCFKMMEPLFPIPEANVAFINSNQNQTQCNLLSKIHIAPLLEEWTVKYEGKFKVQNRDYYCLRLSGKKGKTGRSLELNVE